MSENKHTPGPWRTGHHCRDDHPCDCRYIFGNDDRMGAVAEVHVTLPGDFISDNPPPDEAKANMLLLAAAPDLLDALADLAEAARNACNAAQHTPLVEALANADAALAKATERR